MFTTKKSFFSERDKNATVKKLKKKRRFKKIFNSLR